MKLHKIFLLLSLFAAAIFGTSCSSDDDDKEAVIDKPDADTPVEEPLTEENYALAETQVIFTDYVARIAAATGTNGTGIFMHARTSPNPADRTVLRINFDTRYSFAVLDLTQPATLVMPETGGRYQSAWFITEEHYNPMAITSPGTYTITQEMTGSRFVMVVLRTQVNMRDEADMAEVTALQDKVQLTQDDRGEYKASNKWDMAEILKMRAKYQQVVLDKHITSDRMFGKKGSNTLEEHNCGVAYGWGGLTEDQAVYINYTSTSTRPMTLTLKDVPVADNAFWSVTVYDADGFPRGEAFNINSRFAVKNADGSVTLHFGCDESEPNYMETYEGWNFILRMYLPQQPYFDGTWVKPELVEE